MYIIELQFWLEIGRRIALIILLDNSESKETIIEKKRTHESTDFLRNNHIIKRQHVIW